MPADPTRASSPDGIADGPQHPEPDQEPSGPAEADHDTPPLAHTAGAALPTPAAQDETAIAPPPPPGAPTTTVAPPGPPMAGGPGSQPSFAPADPPAPMCIAQWAAQWPQSAPAGRINCTANRCNRPLAPTWLPALPHDYDHQAWRGVACWDRGYVSPEIFKAFYSPVAACLLECLCITRYESWNRWYCGPCGAMVQSSPLDHITTANHIKQVRN